MSDTTDDSPSLTVAETRVLRLIVLISENGPSQRVELANEDYQAVLDLMGIGLVEIGITNAGRLALAKATGEPT